MCLSRHKSFGSANDSQAQPKEICAAAAVAMCYRSHAAEFAALLFCSLISVREVEVSLGRYGVWEKAVTQDTNSAPDSEAGKSHKSR